ncbi:hypothetical protein [Nocardia cyriacigeorgica]|uniref:hypothetical protein n=1 Tax=Nocardia cyriacigeorgica TaxID=135487 RepID=UPI002456A96A|nr:hypothetical protein [Nocardia cyriacigeorgica]
MASCHPGGAYIDPGEEMRGRVTTLLDLYTEQKIAPAEITRLTSAMTVEDQERVRAAGRAIDAGESVNNALWPGYPDRDKLVASYREYARTPRRCGKTPTTWPRPTSPTTTPNSSASATISNSASSACTARENMRGDALHTRGLHLRNAHSCWPRSTTSTTAASPATRNCPS